MKKLIILFVFVFLYALHSYGQVAAEKNISLSGKIIDSETKSPIEYATISLVSINDSIVAGTSSNAKGVFSLKISSGSYKIKIQFLSFKTYSFSIKEYVDNFNLGTIELIPDNKLDEVNVTAEKKLYEVKFNKRIYNASSDIANRGGNALDVLGNTPSVRVDSEGNITSRGGNVTVLVDGKPQFGLDNNTDILKSIPSNSIDKIEIITRSAKYSAEGGGAILNIITKKRMGNGLNGSVEVHTGTPDNHGFSVFLNEDTDKLSLYSNISFNHENNFKTIDYNQPINNLFTKNKEDRLRNRFLFNLGSDFYIDDDNIINTSILVNFINKNNFSNIVANTFNRSSVNKEDNSRFEGQLGYTKKFKDAEHQLVFNFKYETTFSNYNGQINEVQLPSTEIFQKTKKDQDLNNFLAQVDYSIPLSETGILSTGYKGTFRLYDNLFNVSQFNSSIGDFEVINNLDNNIGYDELVHGFFAQYDNSINKLTYSIGLRSEITDISIKDQLNSNTVNKNYSDLFPSVSLGYELSEKSYLSLSYSRSIERPGIPQISPFIGFSDERFQSVGNLDLNPYYNNYIELLFDTNYSKLSIASSIFLNLSKDAFLSIFEDTGLQTNNGDTIFRRFLINSGNQNLIGIDADITYKPFKELRLRAYLSPYREEISNAFNEDYNITNNVLYASFHAFVTLNNGLRFNIDNLYQSSKKINGLRELRPINFTNVSVSKDILNKKASLTFKAVDIFASKKFERISFEANSQINRNIFYENQFLLSFTYRFNQKRKSKKDRSNELKKDDLEDKQDQKF